MKVTTGPIISRRTNSTVFLRPTLGLVCLLLIFCSINFSQIPAKGDDRTKKFGKSLDKYKKKVVEPAGKDKKIDAPNDDVIRVETNMVVSDVLVVDQKGNALLGLKKEDFVVSVNGVPQDLELFSSEGKTDVPRSIVLILELGFLRSTAERSLEAAKKLVDKLGPKDRMAIVKADINLITDFTDDKNLLKTKLDLLKMMKLSRRDDVSNDNYSTLLAVLNELFAAEDKRPIVIQQVLGTELAYLKEYWKEGGAGEKYPTYSPFGRAFDLPDVVRAVERSRATIYTVIPAQRFVGLQYAEQVARAHLESDSYGQRRNADYLTVGEKNWIRVRVAEETSLISVTDPSGGYTDYLEKPEDADDVYSSIFKVINNRYVIGYYPKNEIHDGKRRTVNIEVRGHPEYTIMGRKTYFAPEK